MLFILNPPIITLLLIIINYFSNKQTIEGGY